MKSSSSNLQVLAFLILVFIFALFCLGTKAVFAVRRRLRKRSSPSASDSSTHVSPPSQAQTQTRTQAHSYDQYITPTSPDCDTERGKVPGYVTSSSVSVVVFEANDHNDSKKPSLSPIVAFMGWRHRVLYESDSIPELALLPSYRPRESVSRKVLNFVLRKKRVRVSLELDLSSHALCLIDHHDRIQCCSLHRPLSAGSTYDRVGQASD